MEKQWHNGLGFELSCGASFFPVGCPFSSIYENSSIINIPSVTICREEVAGVISVIQSLVYREIR